MLRIEAVRQLEAVRGHRLAVGQHVARRPVDDDPATVQHDGATAQLHMTDGRALSSQLIFASGAQLREVALNLLLQRHINSQQFSARSQYVQANVHVRVTGTCSLRTVGLLC